MVCPDNQLINSLNDHVKPKAQDRQKYLFWRCQGELKPLKWKYLYFKFLI